MLIQLKTRFLALFFTLLFAHQISAQNTKDDNSLWQNFNETALQKADKNRQIIPKIYGSFTLDITAMNAILAKAPLRFTAAAKNKTILLNLPMPNGKIQQYKIVEAPVLHPDLAFQFPGIHSYAGQGIDDPKAFLRFDITPKGFHAMISSPHHSTIFIDPYAENDTEHYVVYYRKDSPEKPNFECLVEHEAIKNELLEAQNAVKSLVVGDCILRKYRLALACTGEYAQFHGGTIASVLAAMNTTMTRVNGVFERDVSITMEIISNNDEIIFLNGGSDPYSNDDGFTMLNQNQNTIDNAIGSANYDIGHVFSTGGGGIASLRSPCSPQRKAKGVTGLGNPIGDAFDIDYVAHEMGHQYGGNHTQNNNCNNVSGISVEPGSASTIMGYAGICAPNVQNNSDDYYHIINIREMTDNIISGTSSTCPEEMNLGNSSPTANAGSNYTIPKSTPFELTGTANDNQGNASLTYTWEQMDAQTATMPPSANSTSGPAFRSLSPTASPSRVFPPLNDIINNNSPTWQVLPNVARNMNFTFTARDNNAGNGCTGDSDMSLTVAGNAGPFLVTNPNTSLTWNSGNTETVTWNVANTSQSPVNCANVDILLSTDGGFTYPIIIAENVPNTGSANIMVPNQLGSNNRIRINCSNNVFFDISNTDFTIEQGAVPDFTFGGTPDFQSVCADGAAIFDLSIEAFGGFNGEVSFTVNGLPTGATASFSPETLNPDGTTQMTIGNLTGADAGLYTIEITATSGGITKELTVSFTLTAEEPGLIALNTPINGATDVPLTTTLTWENDDITEIYHVEVASSPSFVLNSIIQSGVSLNNTFLVEDLSPLTVYYWHISGSNNCGDGEYGQIFSFLTTGETCQIYENTESQIISANAALTIMSTINVPEDVTVISTSIPNLDIAHTFVGDVDAHLTSPNGTEINLFDQPGSPEDDFGCSGNDILVSFADNAEMSAADFENTCENSPAIEGNFMPISPFSAVANEAALGDWILSVHDNAPSDGGQLNEWNLEICYELPSPLLVEIEQTLLIVENGESGTITDEYISITSENPDCQSPILIITGLPSSGALFLSGFPLQIGATIATDDLNGISGGDFTYVHDGSDTDSDSFTYDISCNPTNALGGWNGGNTFFIQIVDMIIFAANAEITSTIDCNDSENGQISVEAQGGMAPLMYSIDGENFQNEPIFNNLPAGNYTVTVEDAAGVQITTQEITLSEPEAISATANVVEAEITVDAAGGTGDLTYSIDGVNFQTSTIFPGLDNGTYTITVMDENGCLATIEAIVAVNALVVSVLLTNDISCADANDATITVTVAGGSEPYLYSINDSDPQDSNIFTDLAAGNYTVLVADSDGFEITSQEITVNNPDPIIASANVDEDEITITASGGTGALFYAIDGVNFQTPNIFPGLDNGIYTITIMDENECQEIIEAIVAVNALVVSVILESDISCAGANDATISVSVAGGTEPYFYSINDGEPQESNVFDNLSAGNYSIVVTDSDGFEVTTQEITVTNPEAIVASASVDEFNITVNASGGTGDLTYSIDGVNFQNSNLFPDVDNGAYAITVLDENECQEIIEVTVAVNTLAVSIALVNDISCANENDATIIVIVSGGMSPYFYSINDGDAQESNVFTNLAAGNYTVVVSDSDGFEITTQDITVANPEPIIAEADVDEFDITVNASGGMGNLTYSIDGVNFQSSNIFLGLDNGLYTIIVMDENECLEIIEAVISVNALSAAASIDQEILCANENNGSISVETFGGNEPYQYSLNGEGFQDSPVFDNLPAGEYTVTVMDADGFIFVTMPIILEAPTPIIIETSLDNDNNLTINADGGTGNLTYSIDGDNYEENNVFPALDNGNYTVFVQDENGCISTTDIEINAIISAGFAINGVDCFNDNSGVIEVTEVNGGVSPYTYSLNDGDFQSTPIFENLMPGTHLLIIMDAFGNIYETAITLANPNQIDISPVLTDNNLTINAAGGVGSFQYSIDGGTTFGNSNTFNGLADGEYEIVVEDSNGCQESTMITVLLDGLLDASLNLSLQLFPNPSTGIFTLNINQETARNFNLTVFDALGRKVYVTVFEKTGLDFSTSINLEHLAGGTYFIQLTDGVLVGHERVLIVR